MRRFAGLAGLLVALSVAATARAAEPELTLSWQAPVGCPAQKDVETHFARLLGGPARVPTGKHIDASAAVRAPSTDRWALELSTSMDGATGRRNLSGDSCAAVAQAAALILALMIDPAAAERLSEPARPPPPKAPPPTVTGPAPPPPPPRTPIDLTARVFAGGVFALLPEPAPAAGAALGLRRGRFSAELSALATTDTRTTAPDVATAGGDLRLLAAGARACGALGGHAAIWQLCLGGEVERLLGTGFGAAGAHTETVDMLAGTGGLLVDIPLSEHVALTLDLDAAARAYHPTFVLRLADGTARLWQVPFASAFAAAGIILTL
jgi:hypothetical protein